MRLEVYGTAFAILGEDFSPENAHPALFASKGVVPSNWELAEPPITTRQSSIIRYAEDIEFRVSPDRVEIRNRKVPYDVNQSDLVHITRRFVEIQSDLMPIPRFERIGLNIEGFVELPDSHSFMKERFLKPGPWDDPNIQLETVGVHWVFGAGEDVLRLTTDAAAVRESLLADIKKGIFVKGNYERPVFGEDDTAQVLNMISLYKEKCLYFHRVVSQILTLGE